MFPTSGEDLGDSQRQRACPATLGKPTELLRFPILMTRVGCGESLRRVEQGCSRPAEFLTLQTETAMAQPGSAQEIRGEPEKQFRKATRQQTLVAACGGAGVPRRQRLGFRTEG